MPLFKKPSIGSRIGSRAPIFRKSRSSRFKLILKLSGSQGMTKVDDAAGLRHRILELVDEYSALVNAPKRFVPGETPIPASGKDIGSPEFRNMVEASLDGWLTTGHFNEA